MILGIYIYYINKDFKNYEILKKVR